MLPSLYNRTRMPVLSSLAFYCKPQKASAHFQVQVPISGHSNHGVLTPPRGVLVLCSCCAVDAVIIAHLYRGDATLLEAASRNPAGAGGLKGEQSLEGHFERGG